MKTPKSSQGPKPKAGPRPHAYMSSPLSHLHSAMLAKLRRPELSPPTKSWIRYCIPLCYFVKNYMKTLLIFMAKVLTRTIQSNCKHALHMWKELDKTAHTSVPTKLYQFPIIFGIKNFIKTSNLFECIIRSKLKTRFQFDLTWTFRRPCCRYETKE